MMHVIFEDGTDQGEAVYILLDRLGRITAQVADGRIVRGYLSGRRTGLTVGLYPHGTQGRKR